MIPVVVYKQLGMRSSEPTTMRLLMVARTMKNTIGILCDVLVKMASFIFPTDFVILDCEVDFKVSIILGRPFPAMGRALLNKYLGQKKL